MGVRELREQLRQATALTHSRMDEAVGQWPLSSNRDYAAFLMAQIDARSRLDAAFRRQPPAMIEAPPAQTSLIAHDLGELGFAAPTVSRDFSLDDPYAALGAAWAMSGSSLGNRTLLVRRHKAGLSGAERFLSDSCLPSYFRELLSVLARPHRPEEVAAAVTGAEAAFNIFEEAFAQPHMEAAA